MTNRAMALLVVILVNVGICFADDRPNVMRDATYSLDKDWRPIS